MSLVVYLRKEDIPSTLRYVDNNDVYFVANTPIPDTPLAREILKTIDKAEYCSDKTFTCRTNGMGNLTREYLSTGTKTLLNIMSHNDCCFNIVECGDNALNYLRKLNSGYVFWNSIVWVPTFSDNTDSCDIMCNNQHFTNVSDFVVFVRDYYGD